MTEQKYNQIIESGKPTLTEINQMTMQQVDRYSRYIAECQIDKLAAEQGQNKTIGWWMK